MRVALVNNLYVDQLGYYYIAATLKAAGHDVRFFLTSRSLVRDLKKFEPGLIGMTAVTGNHQWAAHTAWQLKRDVGNVPTILGGPHPTYYPDIVKHPGIDYICRGEGEVPIVALCNALESDGPTHQIPGISCIQGEQFFDNGFADLVEDLDTIPFPDRSIYNDFSFAKSDLHPFMLSSRGCPFKCTFCYAPTLSELTRDKGKFVRFRTVDNVVAEGLELKHQYDVRSADFVDDIFGMKRPWLEEFAERWPREVGLPFYGNLRADLVTEDTVSLLAEAGCHTVAFGVESGSSRVRNAVLQKDVSTEQIVEAAQLLRRHKIRVLTYNILGAPSETFDETLETLRLNQKIKPDYAWASIMQPYPGTKVFEYAVKEGLYEADSHFDDVPAFLHDSSVMSIPRRREVVNLQKFFFIAVRFPWLTPAILKIIRLPENFGFYLAFLVAHVLGFFRIKRVPTRFVFHILLNVKEIWRRHRSGLYDRKLWEREDAPQPAPAPTLKERIDVGAI